MSYDLRSVIGAKDRLSALPDDILCHILSFLSSKKAAQTRILSRSWKHLFVWVQKLIAEGIDTNLEENQEMFDFINRWITLPKEIPVNEFRLISKYLPEESVLRSWLTTLLLFRRIKVLELTSNSLFDPPKLVNLRLEFFRSETLVNLRISGDRFVLQIPGFIHCPSLKTLHLEELVVESESGDFRFADAGYPKLEEFWLKGVNFYLTTPKKDVKPNLTISLANLVKLQLVVDSDWEVNLTERVDIDTKHLKHFQFMVTHDVEVNFTECESLEYADIYQFNPDESFSKLLWQIKNVKMLRLSDQEYNGITASLPQFIHLTHLGLRFYFHKSVWSLLQCAPNLEVLDYYMYSPENEEYLPPANVPHCLSQSIKEIRTVGFRWYEDYINEDEMQLDDVGDHTETIKYFLEHGAVLERVSLGISKMKTAEWRCSTLDLLLNVDCPSPHCQIELREEKDKEFWLY